LPLLLTQTSLTTRLLGRIDRHTCLARYIYSDMTSSCPSAITSLADWKFSDPKLASLPLDKETKNNIRGNGSGAVFSLVRPTPWQSKPRLVAHSPSVLRDLLDLDPAVVQSPEFLDFVAGNLVLPGSEPMAHRYGGHQFGHWAGQLGDGRAHLLGEYVNQRGERWELQLKGSGRTPYSRFGDGRAVLRSSIREFLCSESMYGLGIATSRAAAIVVSDDKIPRDLFYNGRVIMEKGAVVLRLAPSWFRFGSFEILARNGELAELRQLADFILKNNFPNIEKEGDAGYMAMFSQVVQQTAEMIANWNAVGFAHGVMNTDNMSIMSVTIDYGPFGFVDEYNPRFIPNHSDDSGRYDLESQVNIGLWNLDKLAVAMRPLVSPDTRSQMEIVLKGYGVKYQEVWSKLFRQKLGLLSDGGEEDEDLINTLLEVMESIDADFTQTFRDLSELSLDDLVSFKIPESSWGLHQCLKNKKIKDFLALYGARLKKEGREDEHRMSDMQTINPRYILRNWIAQRAIELAENDDFSEVQFLLDLLNNPYNINKIAEEKGYANPPPGWSKKLAVSCSS